MFQVTGAYFTGKKEIEVVFQGEDGRKISVCFPWEGEGYLWPYPTSIGYTTRKIEVKSIQDYHFNLEDFFHSAQQCAAVSRGKIGKPSLPEVWEVDNRDSQVFECPNSEGGYGPQTCYNCVCSRGTTYADGYQSGCVNLPKGARVKVV